MTHHSRISDELDAQSGLSSEMPAFNGEVDEDSAASSDESSDLESSDSSDDNDQRIQLFPQRNYRLSQQSSFVDNPNSSFVSGSGEIS